MGEGGGQSEEGEIAGSTEERRVRDGFLTSLLKGGGLRELGWRAETITVVVNEGNGHGEQTAFEFYYLIPVNPVPVNPRISGIDGD